MIADEQQQRLTLVHGEHPLVVPCVELIAFSDGPLGDAELDFYDRARELLGDTLESFTTGRKRKPWDDAAQLLVPTWLRRPRIGSSYFIEAHGEPVGASAASLSLALHARPAAIDPAIAEARRARLRELYGGGRAISAPPVNCLRVTLPTDHEVALDPSALQAWLEELSLLRSPHFGCAHAGYALNFDDTLHDDRKRVAMHQHVAAACARHPGLAWHWLGEVANHLLRWDEAVDDFVPGIRRVGWLTAIGARSSAALPLLADREPGDLDSGALAARLHDGWLFRAGAEPALGDLNRGDYLPAYRAVARLLRPLRLRSHRGLGRGFSDEVAQHWLESLDSSFE